MRHLLLIRRIALPTAVLALGIPMLALAAQPKPAAAPDASAPISNIRYDVTYDSTTSRTRTIKVAMSFGVEGPGAVLLSLPDWTPGAYEISNFARSVSDFQAMADGKPLRWDKTWYDTWRVFPGVAKQLTVSFDFHADTLDNAMAWSQGDFAFVNGTNIFFYPKGRPLDFKATVAVHSAPDWRVATGMTPTAQPRTYGESNYHDLVDMPFFIGRFDIDSTRIADRWVRIASWPVGALTGAARAEFWEQQKKYFAPMISVFGEAPFATYTTMIVFDSLSGGGSALEHQNSHVGVYAPLLVGNILLPSISAHETFHAWNVKRLRPADMVPYRYDAPEPTRWLWVSEGITDYYADLALVRGGVIDSAQFFELTQGKVGEVAGVPPVAVEDASLSTWIHPTDGTEYIYYPKGSLLGLLLDIQIRDASDNAHSLDDVMRDLYTTTYKRGLGFTDEQWWAAVSRAANGKKFDDFYAKYVDGREPLPFAPVFALAGLAFKDDTIREPRVGVATNPDSSGVRVMQLDPTGAAAAAGMKTGDYLVSIGDVMVTDQDFGPKFRDRYARGGPPTLPVKVRRDGQTLALTIELRFATRVNSHLVANASATPKAARIRAGLLRGAAPK